MSYQCTHPEFGAECSHEPVGFAAYFRLEETPDETDIVARLGYLRSQGVTATPNGGFGWIPHVDMICFPFIKQTLAPLYTDELRMFDLEGEVIDIDPDDPIRKNVFTVKRPFEPTSSVKLYRLLSEYQVQFKEDINEEVMTLEERFHAAPFGGVLDRGWEYKSFLGVPGALDHLIDGSVKAYEDLLNRLRM